MSRRLDDGVIAVALRGVLDASGADQLLDELRHVWGSDRLPVTLDLAEVTFLDSAGLRALVLARRELAAGGRTVTIAAASPKVRRVLELTGIGDLFSSPTQPTRIAARFLRHMGNGSDPPS